MRKGKEEGEEGLHAINKKQVMQNKAMWLCDSMHINFVITKQWNRKCNETRKALLK